ncbi:MAG: hypothetical protein ACXVXO_01100 [Mycobacteriaceae bacterium]
MSSTTVTSNTLIVTDIGPALDFLTNHPDLPVPRGVDLGFLGGSLSLSTFVDTAEQVQAWANAIDEGMVTREHQGNTHYSTHTFDPFYITVTAIVHPERVSA